MRKRSFAPPPAQEFQGNSATRRDAASRPKRSKRPVSDKPMPPRSGKPRRLLELGKLRKAVSMRQEHGIHIDAHDWARAIAAMLAGPAKPTGEDLAWWCEWAGIEPPPDATRMIASTRGWPKWKCPKWRTKFGKLLISAQPSGIICNGGSR